jgi:hypothetical protein
MSDTSTATSTSTSTSTATSTATSASTPTTHWFHKEDGSLNAKTVGLAVFVAVVVLCFVAWQAYKLLSPSTVNSKSVSMEGLSGGKMGNKVFVERVNHGCLYISEISAWSGSTKHEAVNGGVEPEIFGWRRLVDGDPTTYGSTGCSVIGKMWIELAANKDVLVDRIMIRNRTVPDEPLNNTITQSKIRGCKVVLRRVDGSIAWQQIINDVRDEYHFDVL